MSKIKNISGFPEWLPHEKRLEEHLTGIVRAVYESFGFTPIETPAVELATTLTSKGVADKEIYLLQRARAEEGENEATLGLHFDLTVPFARYVAQHFSNLTFPFKRYQLQKVWRGERPQKGRFREFYQFDIDTVAIDELPLSCDAEILAALDGAISSLAMAPHELRINNRKLLHGLYASLGLSSDQRSAVISVVDKLDKIGKVSVVQELSSLGLSEQQGALVLDWCAKKIPADGVLSELNALSVQNELFNQGRDEVARIVELLPETTRSRMVLDLSLARGLDYYTGIIFELVFPEYRDFGSVGSGGRYDNLASQFINKKLPGVGASIGISRLMDLALKNDLFGEHRLGSSDVLVTVLSEEQRSACNQLAQQVRFGGVRSEVYFKAPKLGKQIEYALAKNIPFVLFLGADNHSVEVKNLKTKEQLKVENLSKWIESIKDGLRS